MNVQQRLNSVLAGRYDVQSEIGSGGMATVYVALDVRHNRRVALKVLHPELSAVLGTERFLSEINVTANLQHPHLLPLFDSGEADGLLFYVMPYVEGESLRARLERERQLPVDEAVRIAASVAGALDYAHRHGVIHRDLKPENILLHDGQPLVADFGIALAVSNAGGARITQTGLSLGTPQYMSPEQATGDRVVDARSDVYSLAAVLYEMLAGEPPHMAGTTQALLAKVLTERPPGVRAYRESVPEHVDAAIQRALARLPADRFASAAEFGEVLTGARVLAHDVAARTTEPAAKAAGVSQRMRRARAGLPWALLAAALVFAAVVALAPENAPPAGAPTLFPGSYDVEVPSDAPPGGPTIAISRDGSLLAFRGTADGGAGLFVRPLDRMEAQQRVGGAMTGLLAPAFSPDGEWLAFRSGRRMLKVRLDGGAAVAIAEVGGSNLHWGDDDRILFSDGPAIWRVAAAGGEPERIAAPDPARGHGAYGHPWLLPGGRAALITIWKSTPTPDILHLGVLRLRDGRVTELDVRGFNPRLVAGRLLVYAQPVDEWTARLMVAPFSLSRLRPTGPAVPVLHGVMRKDGGAEAVVSETGTLLYRVASPPPVRRLVRVARNGAASPLGVEGIGLVEPRVSPDGRRVALRMTRGEPDIWVQDLSNGALTRMTTNGGIRPEWTHDGRRIAYVLPDGGVAAQPWDGSGEAVVLVPPDSLREFSLGPPGTVAAVRRGYDGPAREILIAPADSPAALRRLPTSGPAFTLRVSPDGRLLAYVGLETGEREVYVRPVPGPGGRVRVSLDGGEEPVWSPDGRELFYRSPAHLMSAVIARSPELDVLRRDTQFADPYLRPPGGVRAYYDVFPDGSSFVFVETVDVSSGVLLGVVNWTTELERRVAGTGTRR